MVFIILLFFLFLPHFVLATPDISITDYSSGSDTEWILLFNNTDNSINIQNWVIRDENDNTKTINSLILSGCISAKSSQVFTHNKGWLNDTNDTIYLYNSSLALVDKLSYSLEKNANVPTVSNTCLIPTNTPTPTLIPTSTPTPTNTPTPDPTVTNPSSGISLTEFMPYSDPEWVEIYNDNNYPIKLVSWKVEDLDGNTKNIDNLSIPAKGYAIYEPKSLIFDNNSDDKIILRNQDNKIINEVFYSKGLITLDRSWSSISGSWCQASITKGYVNVTSCYATPTSNIITPTNTPTPDSTKYTADETATESAIIEPMSESSFLSPSPTLIPTPTTSTVLGDSTAEPSSKKNYLPLILIIVGGLLLTSPAIISKVKAKK